MVCARRDALHDAVELQCITSTLAGNRQLAVAAKLVDRMARGHGAFCSSFFSYQQRRSGLPAAECLLGRQRNRRFYLAEFGRLSGLRHAVDAGSNRRALFARPRPAMRQSMRLHAGGRGANFAQDDQDAKVGSLITKHG